TKHVVHVLLAGRLALGGAEVVGGEGADEHAGAAALERPRRDAGVLERLPGHLQEQALLRVQLHGLPRRDAEERGIEAIDRYGEQARPARHSLARASAHEVPALVERPD